MVSRVSPWANMRPLPNGSGGSAAPDSADRQRWGTATAAGTVPRIDGIALLGGSWNRVLDSRQLFRWLWAKNSPAEDRARNRNAAENTEEVDARRGRKDCSGRVHEMRNCNGYAQACGQPYVPGMARDDLLGCGREPAACTEKVSVDENCNEGSDATRYSPEPWFRDLDQ